MNTNNVLADELAGYDPAAFDRPSVTVDVVAFTPRRGDEHDPNASAGAAERLHVLLVRRGGPPFANCWALPGGFVRMDEDLDVAARRELAEETGTAAPEYLEQLYTFGTPGRDPRTRVITVAYYALLPGPASALPGASANEPRAGTDAAEARWFAVNALPGPLAFDHDRIVEMALSRLRAKLGYTSVAYALLPAEFTLTELQRVYEIILARPLDKRNFRKKMLGVEGLIEATPHQKRDGAHRPAQLFRFAKREPMFLD